MADDVEWIVPTAPVRDADRVTRAAGLSLLAPERSARVAELRRRVTDGVYASESMMNAVARRIISSGDLQRFA
jgi:hypothetical protein